MPNTMTLISSATASSGSVASLDFTSIPSTYTDLILKGSVRCAGTSNGNAYAVWMSINGVTTNRTWKVLAAYNNSSITTASGTDAFVAETGGTGGTVSTFNNFEIYIPQYTSSNNKTFGSNSVTEVQGTNNEIDLVGGNWNTSAAITSLSVYVSGQNLAQYSTVSLYGIKNS